MFKKLFGLVKDALPQEKPTEEYTAPQQENDNDEVENENDEVGVQYDPVTLHGLHYTKEAFDAEVKNRAEKWIASEKADGVTLDQNDIDNIHFNYRRDLYKEWNGCDNDQMIQWEHANSMEHTGFATSGFAKEDPNNPLLQPVHGIDLRTYTAMTMKITAGADVKEICKAMGIETPVWEEVNTVWTQRMAEDTSFTVSTLFGQYYAEKPELPQLSSVHIPVNEAGAGNLEKMKTDKYFYFELEGARQAAYEYGLDGAQWVLDNYGINLSDFQSVAMYWMEERNKGWKSEEILADHDYQEAKKKEYADKFAAEQGGNVADDVEF